MSSSQAHDQKVLPLTHPIDVATIKPDGLVVNFEATETERAGLAKLFDIPAVVKLNASFKLIRKGSQVKVRGDVSGIVTRLCVLSVEPFDMDFHEAVSVDYDELREGAAAEERNEEGPDPIIDGEIDLGTLAAEFLVRSLRNLRRCHSIPIPRSRALFSIIKKMMMTSHHRPLPSLRPSNQNHDVVLGFWEGRARGLARALRTANV